jgi:hypothetical protein
MAGTELFVITGVRYNWVNLYTKITNLALKYVRYNRVFVNNRVLLYFQFISSLCTFCNDLVRLIEVSITINLYWLLMKFNAVITNINFYVKFFPLAERKKFFLLRFLHHH